MTQNKGQILRERLTRTIAVFLIILLCAIVILKVKNMLLAFVLAFIINYLLAPIAHSVERAGISRSIAVSFIFVLLGLFFIVGAMLLLPGLGNQISSIKHELPGYIDGITGLISKIENNVNTYTSGFFQFDFSKTAGPAMKSFSENIFEGLPGFLSTFLSTLILAPLFAFFMLIDGQKAIKNLLAIVPNNLFEAALNLHYQINEQIGGFVRARLLEATIIGSVVWVGLICIHFQYALFFSFFAGITNLIPYIGPIIGAIPAILLAIVSGGSGLEIFYVAGVYITAQLIDNIFIVPMVVARIVNLHAIIVIVVVIIGAQIGGILGMIISIPVASILKLSAISVYQHMIQHRA